MGALWLLALIQHHLHVNTCLQGCIHLIAQQGLKLFVRKTILATMRSSRPLKVSQVLVLY
ncbi:hypothetical protein Tel_08590 [Candidatus Tenderia electrophaga]|uniref:Uncharacterized protein n=1 Tax=Candidatus Tenderia electrophaga TaxID=1748243 RepID=A0A0S2TDI6_9GAMM|nr:hypothetical protein Tel_08590 [Candidatus Tenderia electrophaga]